MNADIYKIYMGWLNVHKVLIQKDFYKGNKFLLNLSNNILYKNINGNYKIEEIIVFNNFAIKNFKENNKESMK